MEEARSHARRITGLPTAREAGALDVDTRFRTLVQSPLRAGILRYLSARAGETFDVEALMQAFGRLRLDVENCVHELVDFGVVGDLQTVLRAATEGIRKLKS